MATHQFKGGSMAGKTSARRRFSTLCSGKPRKDWLQQDKNCIARSLKALCWKRFQKRIEGDEEKDREWRYRPASPVSPG